MLFFSKKIRCDFEIRLMDIFIAYIFEKKKKI